MGSQGQTVKILAIETSCDETSLALVDANPPACAGRPAGGTSRGDLPRFKIAALLVASQIKVHRPFGGVVPNLAKREHEKNLPILYRRIFGVPAKEKKLWSGIDLIAVTVGPGLEPALWAGITFAEELAKKYKKPLVGANHLEGHLYSFLLSPQKRTVIPNSQFPISKQLFPAVALIVSGGHTILLKMPNLYEWKKIGETRDDAVGEAYDKVARLLNLPYPGGPEVERLARGGNPKAIDFPRPMIYHKNYDFSFSGLKTSVRYHLVTHPGADKNPATKADIAASFQEAVLDVLIRKASRAIEETGAKTLLVSGGVAVNSALRKRFRKELGPSARAGRRVTLYFPRREFCGDNAAMTAAAAYIRFVKGKKYRPAAQANLNM
jgi:N6-L-threonylcarbamoyladenine synthase